MRKAIDHAWRVFSTGLSFFVFGLVALITSFVVLPVMSWFVHEPQSLAHKGRAVISFNFRHFVGFMRALGLLDYELIGFERLNRQGLLLLANHPSLIDTVFLLGFIPDTTCVADDFLFNSAFTGSALRSSGFIRNSAGMEVITQCTAALDAGSNVLIFPEGTRTRLDGIVRLRRGAANIAVRGGHNVTPVIIRCTPRTLIKGEKWWQIPPRRPFFTLRVGDDIAVRSFNVDGEPPALAVRRLTTYLDQYFNTESVAHAVP